MRFLKDEEGQSIIMVAVAMSIFLIGAIGLGLDGSHLYSQRQMAQTAADAAATAGMMSVFNSTNTSGAAAFSTAGSFTCGTSDPKTPCVYALNNGFGGTAGDTVTIDFPGSSGAPGVNLATGYPVNVIRATVSRNVNTFLMSLIGPTATTVQATATAAIVSVVSPVPILVTHPTMTTSLSLQGTPAVKICGGPNRSIQVNSTAAVAVSTGGNASIDLSHAGPNDTGGNCTTGTGADLGVTGGPTTSPSVSYGTTGHYVEPDSWMEDPLAGVNPPTLATLPTAPAATLLANGTSGCPVSPGKACYLFSPGVYPSGIDGKNKTPVMKPGIYYIQSGGMDCSANCDMYMASGFTDGSTGTNTGWDGTSTGGGIMVYNTGGGTFNLGANGTINLIGSPSGSAYKGILFFQDRAAAAATHNLGGGGAMTLTGTIYLTNTRTAMLANAAQFQQLNLQGGSGSGTTVQGEIIVGALQLGGNGSITMNLRSNAVYNVNEVALVQ
ncbi:pilus assembly protein TadG-related protein [Terriglobus albidus]|uniref:pilus assembly protein TadG-related protein n=1 Tax=Terriglobus albidus TaxID=1592106 RepID=UPI0021E04864|nr:pilus assembly protein TadG-related protein [Terriglobus albidus]